LIFTHFEKHPDDKTKQKNQKEKDNPPRRKEEKIWENI